MPRSGQSSKDEILRTFAKMVAKVGYDETNFREIAEQLDISKGTIVHHYGTKDRLLEAVHRDYMERRLGEAQRILDISEDPATRLTALIAQLLIAQRDDRDATITFGREIARFSTLDVMKDVRKMRAQYTAIVHDVIQSGVDSGDFRATDVDLVTLQIFGMCNWSWTWWRTDQAWSVAEIVESWSSSLLSGLKAGRGGKKLDFGAIVDTVAGVIAEYHE